jgi:DNA polymerase-3 subunit alpha (Gram-positive type)
MVYTVIDIETTGLSKYADKVTEIAAAKVKDGEVVKEFQTLVNPEVRIPSFITKLTGIDNKMVKDAPTIDKAIPDFVKFLGEDIFVAHNATFDHGFLNVNAQYHMEHIIVNDRLCTRKLANRILPDLSSKKLGALCDHFNIVNSQAHRAMGDVQATVCVLNNMLNILKNKGIEHPEKVLEFERSSLSDVSKILN